MLRICSLLVLILAPLPAVAEVAGTLRVIDGDTIDVGDTRVRLHGIDAPEIDQRCGGTDAPMWDCGAWVTRVVTDRYEGRDATCTVLDTDRYGRAVARCRVDGEDMGRALVAEGLAFAYRRYAMDYDLDEKAAAVNGFGLHGSGITAPAAFRATGRNARAARNAAAAPEGCAIKGNIASDGERIFHAPGQRWYDRTRVSVQRGERWFCSESEARQAGWRRARQ
ncbi:thermonuclease family protein [Citreimonas sp.]|uniref:thermonuclease family protein n=1 Tax=Citreimonas sp. TaxID=3036715 RepID=UPI0040584836